MFRLTSYDFISFTPSLLIQGNSRMKTALGGTLSLLIAVIALFSCYFFSRDLLQKQNPRVSSNRYYSKTESFLMNKQSFFLYTGVDRTNGQRIPNSRSLYEVVALNYVYSVAYDENDKKYSKLDIRPVALKPCTSEDIANMQGFEETILEGYMCLGDEAELEIRNPLGNPEGSSYLNLFFRPCQPETAKAGNYECLPEEQIEREINQSTTFVGFSSYFFDHNSYSNPVQSYVKEEYSLNSTEIFTRGFVNFNKITYITDEGAILNQEDKLDFFSYDSISRVQLNMPEQFKVVKQSFQQITVAFNSNGLHDRFKRSYKKLQNVLADIGGFYKGIVIILSGINLFFSRTAYMKTVFEESFLSYTKKEYKKINLVGNQGKLDVSGKNLQKIKAETEFSRQIGGSNLKKLRITHKLMLKSLCFKNSTGEGKIMQRLEDFYASVLDVRNLIGMTQKINFLKNAALSREERLVFDKLNFLADIDTETFSSNWSKAEKKLKETQNKENIGNRVVDCLLFGKDYEAHNYLENV